MLIILQCIAITFFHHAGGVAATVERVPGAVAHFSFTREECMRGLFIDSSSTHAVGNLTKRDSSSRCLDGNGVSWAPGLASPPKDPIRSGSLETLLRELNKSKTMTLDFWVEAASTESAFQQLPVAAFSYASPNVACDASLKMFQAPKPPNSASTASDTTSGGATKSAAAVSTVQTTWGVHAQLCDGGYSSSTFTGQAFPQPTRSADAAIIREKPGWRNVFYVSLSLAFDQIGSVAGYDVNDVTLSASAVAWEPILNQSSASGVSFLASPVRFKTTTFLVNWSLHPSLTHAHFADAIRMGGGNESNVFPALTLFGSSSQLTSSLFHMAIYPRALTLQEVERNFRAGLPNSLPLVWNTQVAVWEDGQADSLVTPAGQEYGALSWSDLQWVELPVFDMDDQLWHPNAAQRASNDLNLQVELTALPQRGLLYSVNTMCAPGESCVELPLFVGAKISRHSDGLYYVKYQPEVDRHSDSAASIFDTFVVSVRDGLTGLQPKQPAATVSIVVKSANDRPVATENLRGSALSGGSFHIFELLGTDEVDGRTDPGSPYATVSTAYITSLPQNGTLHMVLPNGTVSAATVQLEGTTGGPVMISSTSHAAGASLRIAYRYLGSEGLLHSDGNGADVKGLVCRDSFQFAVGDDAGAVSRPAVFSVEVTAALQGVDYSEKVVGTPQDRNYQEAVEGQLAHITIYGRDWALSMRPLSVRIDRLPYWGELVDLATMRPLGVGSVITSARSNNVSRPGDLLVVTQVGYRTVRPYFSVPSNDWIGAPIVWPTTPLVHTPAPDLLASFAGGDSFQYSVLALPEVPGNVHAESVSVSQVVAVRNKNDASRLSFAFAQETWRARGFIQIFAYSLSASAGEMSKSVANIHGFTLQDLDMGAEVVRVDVETAAGFVTLNRPAIDGLDFNSFEYCLNPKSNWNCRGTGFDNRVMRFIGTPENVSRALNGLVYLSTKTFHRDHINVTVWDGQGDDCLPQALLDLPPHQRASNTSRPERESDGVQWPISVRPECFRSFISIEVRVEDVFLADAVLLESAAVDSSFKQIKYRIIGGVVLFFLLLMLWRAVSSCCGLSCGKRSKDDGGEEVEDEEDDGDDSRKSSQTDVCTECSEETIAETDTTQRRAWWSGAGKAPIKQRDNRPSAVWRTQYPSGTLPRPLPVLAPIEVRYTQPPPPPPRARDYCQEGQYASSFSSMEEGGFESDYHRTSSSVSVAMVDIYGRTASLVPIAQTSDNMRSTYAIPDEE